jgi:alkanesulfonate monooxygenase SsuD/methylene tetrahydromethanopterin reductase-like flavin-dependent oxidoreductase (luciferase family)
VKFEVSRRGVDEFELHFDQPVELVSRDSPYFRLHNAVFGIPPYRGKWPKIWVAAHGPRMLGITGRYADAWSRGSRRSQRITHKARCRAFSCIQRRAGPDERDACRRITSTYHVRGSLAFNSYKLADVTTPQIIQNVRRGFPVGPDWNYLY